MLATQSQPLPCVCVQELVVTQPPPLGSLTQVQDYGNQALLVTRRKGGQVPTISQPNDPHQWDVRKALSVLCSIGLILKWFSSCNIDKQACYKL